MNKDKDELIFRRHILDLANTADLRNVCVYSDFLNLHEQNILEELKNQLPKISYYTYGGFSDAERKVLGFCGEFAQVELCEDDFPILCIQILPRNQKFSDQLNHRDFLGAILNLGIDRSMIGDIVIEENVGYIFCIKSIGPFIADELVKIKHTSVNCSIIPWEDFTYQPKMREVSGTVSSVRLDSLLSIAFQSSRSSLSGLIGGGKVFVNSKVTLSNSYNLKEGDVVSVRGYGKFRYVGTNHQTKKGRYSVTLLLYGDT